MTGEKILYFDCASGISGDMTLGALLDLGADAGQFMEELKKLPLHGYEIKIGETQKNGIRARCVEVVADEAEQQVHTDGHCHGDPHGHTHGHPHRTYADIRRMIGQSALPEETKDLAQRIFRRVAEAEAKVHGKPAEDVHFHEVGAVDSIIDIVGCAILINMIRPHHIYASALHDGHGFVNCRHGLLAVPVPATTEILAAAGAHLQQIDVEGELVTPTGAAIIAELAESFGVMPAMKIERAGWGAGAKDLPIPNILKIYQGSALPRAEGDEIAVLEANIDDCTGEMLGYAMDALMAAGALDVSYVPIFMKKNRPAYRLTVLARPEDEETLKHLIFRHTTTIGIRRRREKRSVLTREPVTVDTPYGKLKAKKVMVDGAARLYPEYESAVEAAQQSGKSLWEIYSDYGQD